MTPILFILGPSGAGKTTLAENLGKNCKFLHLDFDLSKVDGVNQAGLREEWNPFVSHRRFEPLIESIRKKIVKPLKGASVTCPSGVVLPRDLLIKMKLFGVECVIMYGSRADCLAAFLRREKETGRGFNEEHWVVNN